MGAKEISDEEIRTAKLLLIDDHPLLTEGLAALMQSRGWSVVGQADSAEGLGEKIDSVNPTIVVADIVMPGPCVLSKYKELRKTAQQAMPKLVILSAYFSDFNLTRAFDAEAHGIISKSEGPDEVLNGIGEVISGKRYISPDLAIRLQETRGAGQRRPIGLEKLTPREQEVLLLIAQGKPIKVIAQELKISVKTVDRHRSNLMAKLDCHTQVELLKYAIREGVFVP